MCVKIGEQVQTSKRHVLLLGILGICPWLLLLIICSTQLNPCEEVVQTESNEHYWQIYFECHEYYIYGIVLSTIYILPSLLMVFGVLMGWKCFMIPWLVTAMIYMAGK